MKTEQIIIKVTPEFKQRVKTGAVIDNQNMSEYITSCILFDLAIKKREGIESLEEYAESKMRKNESTGK